MRRSATFLSPPCMKSWGVAPRSGSAFPSFAGAAHHRGAAGFRRTPELAASDSDGEVVRILLRCGDLSPEVLGDFKPWLPSACASSRGRRCSATSLQAFGVLPGELCKHEPSAETARASMSTISCAAALLAGVPGRRGDPRQWLLRVLYPALLRAIEGSRIGRPPEFHLLHLRRPNQPGAASSAALTPLRRLVRQPPPHRPESAARWSSARVSTMDLSARSSAGAATKPCLAK